MMKVKLINNDSEKLLERDINEFLQKIGSQENTTINLVDIKFTGTFGFNRVYYSALIIYNETVLK